MIDILLHLDRYLLYGIDTLNFWIYPVLFLVVFLETGVFLFPWLPGDSLLFTVGTLSAMGKVNFSLAVLWLTSAAILGGILNYYLGAWVLKKKIFSLEKLIKQKKWSQAHRLYKKNQQYLGWVLIIARFMPFIRTFAPFLAGFFQMEKKNFLFFNMLGGIIWVLSLCGLGHEVGMIPWIQEHLSVLILFIAVFPALPILWHFLRKK